MQIRYDGKGGMSEAIDNAVKRGWLIKQVDGDGIIRYIVTDAGLRQYIAEKQAKFRMENGL